MVNERTCGITIWRIFCQAVAPSIEAASTCSIGNVWIPAKYVTRAKGVTYQTAWIKISVLTEFRYI